MLALECKVKQAESMSSGAIGSGLESMPGSVRENVCGGVLGSVLGVYLGAYPECTWERTRSVLGSILGLNLGAS